MRDGIPQIVEDLFRNRAEERVMRTVRGSSEGVIPSDSSYDRWVDDELRLITRAREAKERNLKEINFNGMARLTTIPSKKFSLGGDPQGGKVTIWLPHLPEEISLEREVQFDNLGSQLLTPDGLWIYRGTSPLEIQLSFSLHAFNPLCTEGPKTLLDIAARLHSLAVPASNDTIFSAQTSAPPGTTRGFGDSSQEAIEFGQGETWNGKAFDGEARDPDKLRFPPACSLRLIQAGPKGLGINCVGFVKNPRVKLLGPWLQTADPSTGFNLPSALTAEFTFVHNPSYTNALTGNTSRRLVNAFGPDILQYFYNTQHLSALTGNDYKDVDRLSQSRFSGSDAWIDAATQ